MSERKTIYSKKHETTVFPEANSVHLELDFNVSVILRFDDKEDMKGFIKELERDMEDKYGISETQET